MNTTRVFWKWCAIGLAVAAFLVTTQALTRGSAAWLLQVGEASAVRPLIEDQLGAVPLAEGNGHDGQIFYAMGLDLSGDEVGPLLDHAAYRYRRILFPAIASAFGLLNGWALLYGMITLCVLSMAASAGLVASMAARAGRSDLLALTVVLNPGIWLSVRLLTSDALALALMIAGLYFFLQRRERKTLASFALCGLAKDVNLMTPIPLGLNARNWKLTLVPVAALGAWTTFLSVRLGDGFAARGNLDWPFLGMVGASQNWVRLAPNDWFYLLFALGSVMVGLVFSVRATWLRWPIAGWSALAVLSSSWVWDFGNNAARAFAPIVVLVALSSVYVAAKADSASHDLSATR